MLPTQNYKRAFKFAKIIIRNTCTVSFFTPDAVKRHFRWRHNYVSTK